MSWQDAINASMGRAQDTTYDVAQVSYGNWQGPADGGAALLSAINGQPLMSAIDGQPLSSAIV